MDNLRVNAILERKINSYRDLQQLFAALEYVEPTLLDQFVQMSIVQWFHSQDGWSEVLSFGTPQLFLGDADVLTLKSITGAP